MEFSYKKIEKTSKLINYLIAIALCGFLIALSSKLIDDVDDWKERPTVEQFENRELINKNDSLIDLINEEINLKNAKKANIESTITITLSNYENAKKSFDNWLAARQTVGSPKEDVEVLSRANELDNYYKTEQEWRRELASINEEIAKLYRKEEVLREVIYQENNRASDEQEKAIRKYDLKVFLIRLLFILPILLLGIFFIIKFRKHKYWPLFLGFVLFSFYAFFVGLVPYLPSYGGYIRYTVGVVLCMVFGIYIINKIRAFVERKKIELKVPTTERAKKIQTEAAEKALANHICPSCNKDFIIKPWDKSSDKKNTSDGMVVVTNFCRFCGLELFKKCNKCGTENYAHLPYCSNCGVSIIEEK